MTGMRQGGLGKPPSPKRPGPDRFMALSWLHVGPVMVTKGNHKQTSCACLHPPTWHLLPPLSAGEQVTRTEGPHTPE